MLHSIQQITFCKFTNDQQQLISKIKINVMLSYLLTHSLTAACKQLWVVVPEI